MATREQYDRDTADAELASKISERFAEVRVAIARGEKVDWPLWEEKFRKALEDDLAAVFILIFMMMRDDSARGTQLASAFVQSRSKYLADRLRLNWRNELNSGQPADKVLSDTRALTIAITEVTNAISEAENAARAENAADKPENRAQSGDQVRPPVIVQDGITAIWQTAEDERVCPICWPLNDQPAKKWADRFPKGPPAHIRCVLAETPVCGASLIAASHIKYKGPVVTIHLSDGSSFRVTANHMLLTTEGFSRASDIVNGDNLISTSLVESNRVPDLYGPNNNWKPPLAENVFHSFSVASGVVRSSVPVSSEHLHGDGAFGNGDVDIVGSNRFLRDDIKTGFGKPLDHLQFILGGDAAGSLPSSRSLANILKAFGHATDSGVSSLRELHAIALGKLRHAKSIGLASGSDWQSEFDKTLVDCLSANANLIANLQHTLSEFVSTTKVVEVNIDTLTSHVSAYDFETLETTYIIGNGIVSSNCRCYLIYK